MEIHLPVSYSTFEKQFQQIKHHQTLPEILEDGIMSKNIAVPFFNLPQENITEFKDILWLKDYDFREDGYAITLMYRALVSFDNGYSLSIINGILSEGKADEYEIALKDSDGICWLHEKDVSFDALGHLTASEVSKYLKIVSKL